MKLYCKVLAIVMIFSLAACERGEDDGSGHTFYYDLDANPRTLDPQTAVDASSLTVITNLFEGLLRLDSEGKLVAGAATQYTVSDDGLIYEFILREDIFWTDKNGFDARCTSLDFVFAFKRLFNPATKSRNAEAYFCIKNAEAVNDSRLDLDWIGVNSDGDFKLRFVLEYPDPNFPLLLADTPAFPCNEEFYIRSEGRYGLITGGVPSNGAFYLSEWVYDEWWTDENRVILKRNIKNSENELAFPAGINFRMNRGDSYSLFESGASDCVILSGDKAVTLIKKNFPYDSAENAVWGIVFDMSGGGSFLNKSDFRHALALATDRGAIDANTLGYVKTSSLIPPDVKVGEHSYRDLAGNVESAEANTALAKAHYDKATALFGEISSPPVIIVPSDKAILEIIGYITQQWQEKLSFFCHIESLPPYDYNERLADGDYDLAVVKIPVSYNSPSAVFDGVFVSDETRALYEKARFTSDAEESAALYKKAEERVIESACVIPVCFQTEYFFRNKKSEGLIYNPFARTVNFKEGKVFKNLPNRAS
ncbi:MAG: peptide ABC transporter substrate-binding protein [Oscillospiraceae bacterium]|nr:peptide ABC transporter substrate-binding protein [Oscillospiraceae bacterium]